MGLTVNLDERFPKVRTLLNAAFVTAALLVSQGAHASAQPTSGTPAPCSSTQNGSSVTIQSCTYTLESSPGGNAEYFVNVKINYAAPNPTMAVRFRCMLGNGSSTVAQYGVLRASGTVLQFVSPFVSQANTLKSVACSVDAT